MMRDIVDEYAASGGDAAVELQPNADNCRYGVCKPDEPHMPWCTEYSAEEQRIARDAPHGRCPKCGAALRPGWIHGCVSAPTNPEIVRRPEMPS